MLEKCPDRLATRRYEPFHVIRQKQRARLEPEKLLGLAVPADVIVNDGGDAEQPERSVVVPQGRLPKGQGEVTTGRNAEVSPLAGLAVQVIFHRILVKKYLA